MGEFNNLSLLKSYKSRDILTDLTKLWGKGYNWKNTLNYEKLAFLSTYLQEAPIFSPTVINFAEKTSKLSVKKHFNFFQEFLKK